MIDPVGVLDRLQKKILYRYDRFIARHADILIANTETHAQRLKDVYGCQNVHVIRNSFDPADFAGTSALPKFEKLTISHVGSIYGKRNADLLFAAINRLAKEFAPEKLKLNVVFLGSGGGGLLESIARYDLAEYVTLIDQVPHKEAIEFMSRSHVLLLIKATGKWSRGQIPGKFFEYVGSGNPVLCIGPRDSEVADIINDCRLGHVVEDSHEEMLGIIRKLYARYLETGALPALMEQQVAPFSSPVMVGKMCTALEGE
jgi:glycosyltransferase involved in cell wall biosynthesis